MLAYDIGITQIKDNWETVLYWSQNEKDIKSYAIMGFNTTLKSFGNIEQICSRIEDKGYGKVKNYNFPLISVLMLSIIPSISCPVTTLQ